jgi:hypothetical protein
VPQAVERQGFAGKLLKGFEIGNCRLEERKMKSGETLACQLGP